MQNFPLNGRAKKTGVENLHSLRREMKDLRRRVAEVAEREGDFDRVAQIRCGELPKLEKPLCRLGKEARQQKGKIACPRRREKDAKIRFIKEVVDEEGYCRRCDALDRHSDVADPRIRK